MSRFNLRGKMTVTVHQARNLTNKILIGQMDPYAVVKLSNSKDTEFKTKIAKDQHQSPVWEQSYIFNLEGREELLHANVWHSAALSDDNIGRMDLPLDSLDLSGRPRWYQLKNKSDFTKQTGELSMSIVFEGSGLPAGSVAFTTNASRTSPVSPSAAAASASPAPVIAAQVAFTSSPSPPPVQQQQQQMPQYQQQPQQQMQYGSQPGQPQFQPPQYGQPQQQQQFGQPQFQQQPYSSQPNYQQPPVYQQQPQPVYQAAQPVYQAAQMQPQFIPAGVTFQPAPAAVIVQQQPIPGFGSVTYSSQPYSPQGQQQQQQFSPQNQQQHQQHHHHQQQQPQPQQMNFSSQPRTVTTFQPTNAPQYRAPSGGGIENPPGQQQAANHVVTFRGYNNGGGYGQGQVVFQ